MKSLVFIILVFISVSFTAQAAFQYLPGGSDDEYEQLISQANDLYDSYKFTEAKILYEKALALKPNSKLAVYKLQDIKTMQELFKAVENYDKIAETNPVIPKIIEKKVIDESVAENKVESVEPVKLTENSTENTIVRKTDNKLKPTTIVELPVEKKEVPATEVKPVVKETVVVAEQPKLTEAEVEEAYQMEQKRLLDKYPVGKTIEHIDSDVRKVTRIIVSDGKKATIYLRVQYSWGGLNYYIDESPKRVYSIDSDEYAEVAEGM